MWATSIYGIIPDENRDQRGANMCRVTHAQPRAEQVCKLSWQMRQFPLTKGNSVGLKPS